MPRWRFELIGLTWYAAAAAGLWALAVLAHTALAGAVAYVAGVLLLVALRALFFWVPQPPSPRRTRINWLFALALALLFTTIYFIEYVV